MNDSYISFWTIVWWAIGALLGLGAVGALMSDDPKRGETFIGGLILSGLVVGIGFLAQGSRSGDALAEANRNVAKAYADLQALPFVGSESLLSQCVEASIVGKDTYGRDTVKCKQVNGQTITFSMP